MKLKTARFTDASMTLIRYEEIVDNGEIKIEHETYDTSSERCQAILKQISPEQLTENLKKFEEDEAKFLEALEHLKDQELGAPLEAQPAPAEPLFKTLNNISSEDLFQLKLEIFEDPKVKDNISKDMKSRIRKSENVFETIALYHSHVSKSVG